MSQFYLIISRYSKSWDDSHSPVDSMVVLCAAVGGAGVSEQWPCDVHGCILWVSPGRTGSCPHRSAINKKGSKLGPGPWVQVSWGLKRWAFFPLINRIWNLIRLC